MREIIFRGKHRDTGRWVYGDLIHNGVDENNCLINYTPGGKYICIAETVGLIYQMQPVLAETVGQYIGLTDKNGMQIFEGDLVKTKHGRICNVMWFDPQACWDLKPVSRTDCPPPDLFDLWYSENLEVIGNVLDNSELLEATK